MLDLQIESLTMKIHFSLLSLMSWVLVTSAQSAPPKAPQNLRLIVAQAAEAGQLDRPIADVKKIIEAAYEGAKSSYCAPAKAEFCKSEFLVEVDRLLPDALQKGLLSGYENSLSALSKESKKVQPLSQLKALSAVSRYFQNKKISLDGIGLLSASGIPTSLAGSYTAGYLLNFNARPKMTEVSFAVDMRKLQNFVVPKNQDGLMKFNVQVALRTPSLDQEVLNAYYGFPFVFVVQASVLRSLAKNPEDPAGSIIVHELRHAIDLRDSSSLLTDELKRYSENEWSGKNAVLINDRLQLLTASPTYAKTVRDLTHFTLEESGRRASSLSDSQYQMFLQAISREVSDQIRENLKLSLESREPSYERRAYAEQARYIHQVLGGGFSDYLKQTFSDNVTAKGQTLGTIVCLTPGGGYLLLNRTPVLGSAYSQVGQGFGFLPVQMCEAIQTAWSEGSSN